MQTLSLNFDRKESPSVLCLGAHCDDIEIGCGGTLLRMAKEVPNAYFDWIVFCGDSERRAETERAAQRLIGETNRLRLQFLDFRDGFLPYSAADVKDALREVSMSVDPDLVLTHYRMDAHQDHRIVSEITGSIFRNHIVLEYEVPKYDGDLGQPNVYFSLDEDTLSKKVSVLLDSFRSQVGKHWFTEETFRALPRLRGIESGRGVDYAEAFYGHKILVET